jgi:hypothetical protein
VDRLRGSTLAPTVTSDRPVFVVGCPRSGTTLLGLMLHAHPRLAIPPETRFLLPVWRSRARFGDLSTVEQRRALARACAGRGSRVSHLGLDPAVARREVLAAPPTVGSAIGTVFRLFAEAQGAARWGDKRPAYFSEVDVLLRLFPDAQILQIVRDGRANVASLKSMPWWPYDSVASTATWAQAEYCARRNVRRLPRDVFHVVRYESLVADPEPVLRDVCTFLDEELDPAMLEPARVRGVVPHAKTWHARLDEPVSTARVESWRRTLEPWELGLAETVLGRALARCDYPLTGMGRRPGPLMLARYARAIMHRQVAMHARWASERREARSPAYPVAARLTSRQRAPAGLDR